LRFGADIACQAMGGGASRGKVLRAVEAAEEHIGSTAVKGRYHQLPRCIEQDYVVDKNQELGSGIMASEDMDGSKTAVLILIAHSNILKGLVNLKRWTSVVFAARLETVRSLSTLTPRLWEVDFEDAWRSLGDCRIVRFTEYRSVMTQFIQLTSPRLFYHAFVILEVVNQNGGIHMICLEKYNDKLEFGIGEGHAAQDFYLKRRPTGDERKRTSQHDNFGVSRKVTVADLSNWLDGVDGKKHQAYCLVRSNCQHYVGDLKKFLLSHRDCDETS